MYLGLFLWYTNRLEDKLYKFFKKNPTIFLNFQISSQPRVFMKFSNWFNVSLIWSLSWPSGRLSFCSSCNNSMAWTKISLGSYKVFLKNILKLACTYLICLLRPWSSMPVMEKIFFLSSWACYLKKNGLFACYFDNYPAKNRLFSKIKSSKWLERHFPCYFQNSRF